VTPGFLDWQTARFDGALRGIAQRGLPVPVRMLASSGILLQRGGVDYDAVDPGHILFGLSPGAKKRVAIELLPALARVTSRLIEVKPSTPTPFPAEAPFPARPGLRIGILPIGLRDGFERWNAGHVIVRGRKAPLLGRPSLEHTRIDVTGISDAAPGDVATLIGGDIGIEEIMARHGHPRALDVMMAIAASVPRVAVSSGGRS
jgi:alanine racemase